MTGGGRPRSRSSYAATCLSDLELRTFDTTLQRRTSRAISTLVVGVEVWLLSLDSLREVTGYQEVVRTILDCKKDICGVPSCSTSSRATLI